MAHGSDGDGRWLGKFRESLGQKDAEWMQNGCRMDAEWMQNGTEFSGAKEENMFVNML